MNYRFFYINKLYLRFLYINLLFKLLLLPLGGYELINFYETVKLIYDVN